MAGVTQRRPPGSGQQPRQGCQHGPVGWFQVRALYLAPQYRDLVPKNEDLHFLGLFATGQQDDQLQCLPKEQVPERQDHDHDHGHDRR